MERPCKSVKRLETYPVKGEPITVMANVLVCAVCGTDIFDEALDAENLALAYSQYRNQKGLLGPDDIRRIRKKYGLSQRGIASLLGWSQATIARYEGGAIPSIPHSEQLRRFDDDLLYAQELFNMGKDKLGNYERRKAEKTFGFLKLANRPQDFLQDLIVEYISRLYSAYEDSFRGRRQFDLDKLTNMIIFFTAMSKNMVKSKLLKLLWYSDFLSYKRLSQSISGTVYCHNYYGPIPLAHEAIIEYLTANDIVALRPYDGPYEGDYIESLVEFDNGLFGDEELRVLEDVHEAFRDCSAATLSEITHKEIAYADTQLKEPISYEFAGMLTAIK
ncbi:MAG: DUF4065 domain-containing protein [Firmicutes bacterium]|nr:DUF4065 domain-containing protein [Bacillota bacterium]